MAHKIIEVVKYNPNWPRMFEEEATFIENILGEHCLEIHHIGSTAVPRLTAKRDIDILCVIDQLNNSLLLQEHDYKYKGELNIPLRYYFSKNTVQSKVNLHIVEKGHDFIKLNLWVKDYLINNEQARLDYSELKEKLLQDQASHIKNESNFNFPIYTLRKNEFIKNLLIKSGFDGLMLNFCMHDIEWKEYHRIKKEQIFDQINIVYDPNYPIIMKENNHHFVLYKGGIIIAIARIELLNIDEAALRAIAVDAPYKKLGYGAYIMRVLEKWVKSQGRKIIKFHAFKPAENFYRKLGYIDMEFNDPPVYENSVDLGKNLKQGEKH